jgi:hypothetical protein
VPQSSAFSSVLSGSIACAFSVDGCYRNGAG